MRIYSKDLTKLKQVVAANKMDLPCAEENLQSFKRRFKDVCEVFPVSAMSRGGRQVASRIRFARPERNSSRRSVGIRAFVYERNDGDSFEIVVNDDGSFEVVGALVDSLARKVLLDDYDSLRYMQKTLKNKGVFAALKRRE